MTLEHRFRVLAGHGGRNAAIDGTLVLEDTGRAAQRRDSNMQIHQTDLPDVLVLEPKVFEDHRGFFLESYHAQRMRDAGIPGSFVQDNLTCSKKGVLRGLHHQLRFPQGKLVTVVHGEVFDVVADIRRGSPTFGTWVGVSLSDRNRRQIYAPPGFVHGFCVVSDIAYVAYNCTDYYYPEDEFGIAWDDWDLAIDWPVEQPDLSEKDRQLVSLCETAPDELPIFAAPS